MEKQQKKDRKCNHCEQSLRMTAPELVQHAITCKRLKALGLVSPAVVSGKQFKIVTLAE